MSDQTGLQNPAACRAYIQARVRVDANSGCWEWQHWRDQDGYGRTAFKGIRVNAHRFAYIAWNGPVAPGLVMDHLCRNPGCVNPAHLEPVTTRENLLRGETVNARFKARTHCARGHEYTPENTRVKPDGRECRACDREDYPRKAELRRARRARC